ncbi:MAG: hypothetical protein LBQ52_03015 [Helicobacteraceae bacterium]|jgi:hypothetical protein|nr:hypothetical protein [Helicobacteraceae bacterium]
MTETPRNLFVNPRDLLAIVPYWTIKEAEECAKIIWAFTKIRVQNGSDRAYGASDFRSLAFEGILVAKQKYEKDGEKLRVEQCRGYIQSYTNEETRKKKRKNIDAMDSGKSNLVREDKAFTIESNTNEEEIKEEQRQELIKYISRNEPRLLKFAKKYLLLDGDPKALKAEFGQTYSKNKKQFLAVAKTLGKVAQMNDSANGITNDQ